MASAQTRRVLDALTHGPTHGYELMKATGLASGTLYPILARLRARGVVVDEWETEQPVARPRRRVYALAPGHVAERREP